MSDNQAYAGIRIELLDLKGKSMNEAYDFFNKHLGNPDEIDEFEGNIYYFSYNDFKIIHDNNKNWGIDIPLENKGDDYYMDVLVNVDDIESKVYRLFDKFPVPSNKRKVSIVAYNWYNGGDEPIRFD